MSNINKITMDIYSFAIDLWNIPPTLYGISHLVAYCYHASGGEIKKTYDAIWTYRNVSHCGGYINIDTVYTF